MNNGLSCVIPTFNRNKVLIDTISYLFEFNLDNFEILIVDQTASHDPNCEIKLFNWNSNSLIRWIRLKKASITEAMNFGLLNAKYPIVLFLDDDIIPAPNLIISHLKAYDTSKQIWAVAGQILQPNEKLLYVNYKPQKNNMTNYLEFPFNSNSRTFVENVMAGNLSVLRKRAITIGGFDENFIPPVAYRFETEFAKRIISFGGKILFEPTASITHLRATEGGTRSKGKHLSSISPIHGVGDYYYALKHGQSLTRIWYIIKRPFREVRTKFHFKKPWWIPFKLIGELRALFKAIILYNNGPKYIGPFNRYHSITRQSLYSVINRHNY